MRLRVVLSNSLLFIMGAYWQYECYLLVDEDEGFHEDCYLFTISHGPRGGLH